MKGQGKCSKHGSYRSSSQMNACYRRLQSVEDKMCTCIIDTWRNYLPRSNENEWCDTINTGIGPLPTTNTDFNTLDAYISVKPAGESDEDSREILCREFVLFPDNSQATNLRVEQIAYIPLSAYVPLTNDSPIQIRVPITAAFKPA